MDDLSYSIGELADLAGVTQRTIRYYTAEGLLPPPDTRGKHARYSEEHLIRLELIGRMKERYLPLGEIRAQLSSLSGAELRALRHELAAAPEPPAQSAAEYIQQVLGPPQPAALRVQEGGVAYARASGGLAPGAPVAPAPAAAPPPAPALPAAAPPPAPAVEQRKGDDPQQARGPGLLGRLLTRRAPRGEGAAGAAAEEAGGERWRRVPLAPGVELHIQEGAGAPAPGQVERLVAYARQLFRPADGDD